jgi:RNA ligase (TIGR02306 family)
MNRKLASIQIIEKLEPIAGADFIEKATILGWSTVVKKGEFEEGNLCVFFEIDSVLPSDAEWAQFMEHGGFRVRTKKLRGVLSQGLALPITAFPGYEDQAIFGNLMEGDDVTEQLGVLKYEPPRNENADDFLPFPAGIPKTDEIRVQSAPGVIDELSGLPVYVAVKLDGTSATFANIEGEFIACSRNNRLKNLGFYGAAAERYNLKELIPDGYAIQGEICGPKIQKNRLGLTALDFFVFNVFDIKQGRYLNYDEFIGFCDERGFKAVPIESVEIFRMDMEELLARADGYYVGTKNRREGLVIRPLEESVSSVLGGRLSIKAISNKFLLKGGED